MSKTQKQQTQNPDRNTTTLHEIEAWYMPTTVADAKRRVVLATRNAEILSGLLKTMNTLAQEEPIADLEHGPDVAEAMLAHLESLRAAVPLAAATVCRDLRDLDEISLRALCALERLSVAVDSSPEAKKSVMGRFNAAPGDKYAF